MALTLAYYRTWYGNLTATDNLATTPADYNGFCVTTPADLRLPGGGGQQLCGLYDINPTRFGLVDNVVTQASNYGKRTEVFDGVDVGIAARFGHGAQLNGGVSVGRTVSDACAVVESPQEVRPEYCRATLPWWQGQGQVKFNAIYPLPWWGLQTSGTYQNIAGAPAGVSTVLSPNGVPFQGTWAVPNALISPSLGRPLAAGANANATIPLIPTYSQFEDRLQQVDVRLTKTFLLGRKRLGANFDIYNVFNANTVLASNPVFGANFLVPTAVLGPRLFKLQVQLDF